MKANPAPAPIPAVVVEEHNEALTALIWARQTAALGPEPVRLYNVDQHADLDIPRLKEPLVHRPQTVQQMREFVSANVAISSFIWMGAYLELIGHLSWLQPTPPIEKMRAKASGPRKLFIATQGAARTEFITAGVRAETDHVGNDDRRFLTIETVGFPSAQKPKPFSQAAAGASGLSRSSGPELGDWVLSIDLDYFSCNSQPHNPFRLDVTEATFNAIRVDRRHPLRLSVYHDITLVHDEAGYGVLFDDFPEPQDDLLRKDQASIQTAMLELEDILKSQPWKPAIIIISRSRLSGFTPKDQWQEIEQGVLGLLKNIYDCECFEGDQLWS